MSGFFIVRDVNAMNNGLSNNKWWVVVLLIAILQACSSPDLRICFTGDLLLDRGVRTEIEHHGADALFEQVAPVFADYDAVVVNLECPVSSPHTPVNKRYVFSADKEWLKALFNAGITHAVLANNHSYDQGRTGLEDTYCHLKDAGLIPVGMDRSDREACQPVFITKGSLQVALFSSVLLPLENWTPLSDDWGPCQASVEELCAAIKFLKDNRPSCRVVVVLHWGVEYACRAMPEQFLKAHQLVDSGADAVIGHHPHVVQQHEIYKGRPVYYSLGNFIFDARRPEANEGLMIGLVFTEQGIAVKEYPVHLTSTKPIPDIQ